MLERYSHIRIEAKRRALEVLSGRKGKSYGTNGGTKTDEEASVPPFLAQKLVGTCGFEPQTPTVSRWAEGLPTPPPIINQPKAKPRDHRKSAVEVVRAKGSREKLGMKTLKRGNRQQKVGSFALSSELQLSHVHSNVETRILSGCICGTSGFN